MFFLPDRILYPIYDYCFMLVEVMFATWLQLKVHKENFNYVEFIMKLFDVFSLKFQRVLELLGG